MFDRLRFLFSIALIVVPIFALVRAVGKDKEEKAVSTSTVVAVAEAQPPVDDAAAREQYRQQMLQHRLIGNSYRREARALRGCRQ